jgi:hypothetical protein
LIRPGFWIAAALTLAPVAHAGETPYTFDAADYAKKPVEFGGYLELKADHFDLNRASPFHRFNDSNTAQRANLDRGTATLKLTGKLRAGDFLLSARSHSEYSDDQSGDADEHRFDEFLLSWKPSAGISVEAGKTVLKWGKGYAWNPVGFVERPKDPNDPELAREGFTVLALDIVRSFEGPLKTVALTTLALPVTSSINSAYGRPGHGNLGAKLYLLAYDTDIDFYYVGRGSRGPRVGMDFSRNLSTNLEIHGEFARIRDQEFAVASANGQVARRTESVNSWLIGLRYLNERETTYIAEYYRNGTGFAQDEYRGYLDLAQTALQAGPASALYPRAQALTPMYARPTPLRDYLYLRVSQKEPFDILYLTPALTTIVSLADRSYSIAPELGYTGFKDIELRARAIFLGGGHDTDFGSRQNRRRVELLMRLFF